VGLSRLRARRGSVGGAAASADDHGEEPLALEDDEVEAVWAELERRRAEWMEEFPPETAFFKIRILGGVWAKRHLNVTNDAFQGYAAGASARQWCRSYALQDSMRFNISAYGVKLCAALCNHWRRRVDHYFQIWLAQEEWAYVYKPIDFEGAPFTAVLCDELEHVPTDHPAWQAYIKVEELKPRVLGGAASSGSA
jgi:hypothetical protein